MSGLIPQVPDNHEHAAEIKQILRQHDIPSLYDETRAGIVPLEVDVADTLTIPPPQDEVIYRDALSILFAALEGKGIHPDTKNMVWRHYAEGATLKTLAREYGLACEIVTRRVRRAATIMRLEGNKAELHYEE